jgi:hypothetical protein
VRTEQEIYIDLKESNRGPDMNGNFLNHVMAFALEENRLEIEAMTRVRSILICSFESYEVRIWSGVIVSDELGDTFGIGGIKGPLHNPTEWPLFQGHFLQLNQQIKMRQY